LPQHYPTPLARSCYRSTRSERISIRHFSRTSTKCSSRVCLGAATWHSNFCDFDADGNTTNPDHRKKHARDNGIILKLLGGDPADPFPTAPVWHDKFVVWPANLGTLLKAEVGAAIWEPAYSAATMGLGNPEGSFAKNTVHIGEHLALLKAKKAPIPTLDRICSTIMGAQ
jgi:hypothetical protein